MGKDVFNMDEDFDFLSEVLPGQAKPKEESRVEIAELNGMPTNEDLVLSSYLLVNTLLNLLVRKNIIRTSEVQSLLKELHKELFDEKGR